MESESSDEFTCTISEAQAASGAVTVLTLAGPAKLGDMDAFTVVCNRVAAGRPSRTIVDMTRLTFITSLAIGSIVSMHRGVKTHGGRIEIAGPDEKVADVLDRTRLNTLLTIYPTLEAALAV